MIVVAGQWEIGYNAPLMEVYQWSLPLRDFGISEWLMTPQSGITNREHQVTLKEFENYDDMLSSYEELPRVFLEPRTRHYNPDTTWLHEFEHPKDCIYVFGSAHYNPTLKYKRKNDHIVTIKTKQDKGVLWSPQCAVVLLYDRFLKEQYGSNYS